MRKKVIGAKNKNLSMQFFCNITKEDLKLKQNEDLTIFLE